MQRLLPIVFDDKALSGVFTLIILPAYLSPPLLNRECYGLPSVKQYHGTLTPPRIAPSRPKKSRDGSIIIPNFSIMASSRTTRLFSLSVDRSLPSGGHGGRRQVASRKEERSAALTIQLSRNREGDCCLPLHFTTDIFLPFDGYLICKIFVT